MPPSSQPSDAEAPEASRNGHRTQERPVKPSPSDSQAQCQTPAEAGSVPQMPPASPAAETSLAGKVAGPAVPASGSPPPGSPVAPPPPVPWLPALEAWQKAVLAAVPVVYVMGYLVWAYHAWRYGLGSLPAVQSQYLSAGIGPALVIVLAVVFVRTVKAGLEAAGALFMPGAPPWKRRIGRVVSCLYGLTCLLSAVLLVLALMHRLPFAWLETLYPLSYVAVLGFVVLTKRWEPAASGRMTFDRSDWQSILFLPALVAALFIYIYARFVFPNVPQELGGALPRIARLDLDRDSLAAERLGALFPPAAAHSRSKVAETRPVYVFFAGTQSLLVKPYARWTDNRTYEVETATVRGITWLDRDGRVIPEPANLPLKAKRPAKAKTR